MARVLTKRSTVSGHEPTASDLEVGEIAVNTADSRLFTKHSDGVVKNLTQGQLCSISLQTIGIEYKDADEVYLNPGAVYIVGPSSEGLYYLQGQTALLFSGLSNSTWYAVYVVQPASGNTLASTDFTWSSTMPTRNFTKQGWYHPSNTSWRCVGFVRSNSSSNIAKFTIAGGFYRLDTVIEDLAYSAGNINTTTDVTLSIPMGDLLSFLHVTIYRYTTDTGPYIKTYGATESIGISWITTNNILAYHEVWVKADSNKKVTFGAAARFGGGVSVQGFMLPDWIQTGASGGSETVSPVAVDWATTTRGLQSIAIEYKDSDEIYLNPGSIHIWGSSVESVYQLPAQISKQLTGLSASTWYAIYVAQPTGATISASNIEYSSTMPTRDLAKQGWYDSTGQKRCIGFVFAVATNTLISFIVSDNTWRCDDGVLSTDYNATIPNTSYTTITLNVPVGNTEAWVRFIALYSSGSGEQYCYLKVGGTGPISLNTVGCIGVDFPRTDLNVSFPVNSSKQVAIRASNTATSTLILQTYGFVYPEHIYTGPAGGTERSIQTSFDLSKRGTKTGLNVGYSSSSAFTVDGGVIHVNDGSNDLILEAASQISKSVTGLSTSTWYAVYVDPPDSGTTLAAADIEYSSTMPTWDNAKAGWYHPTNTDWRCIGVFWANAGSGITEFVVNDGLWSIKSGSVQRIMSGVTLTTSPTTATLNIPFANVMVQFHYLLLYGSGSDSLTVFPSGVTGYYGGIGFGRVTSGTPNCYDTFWCPISGSKQISIQSHFNVASVAYVDWTAFHLPKGL